MKQLRLKVAVLILAALFLLTACGKKEGSVSQTTEAQSSAAAETEQSKTESQAEAQKESQKAAGQESWTFKDQADNEVTVKIPVERMVVMQHHSLDILAQLGAQDKVVATEKNWKKDLGAYMETVFPGIDSLPTPGDLTEWNVEEIAALKPDVVIAASQAKPEAIQQLKDLGIPVVVVSLRGEGKQAEAQSPRLSDADKAYTDGCEWAVKTLGKLTGTDSKADDIWNFCLESRKLVDDAVGSIPDDQRVRVFIANEGEQTYGNDKYVGSQLLRAGAINVAAQEIQGYKPYTFEKLAEWNPDVIIVQDRYKDVYDQITVDAKYKELKAVKENKVLLAPYWTKPWGNPDTDSIALGELWLASQFYPDKISKDVVLERAKAFYKNFYGVDFNGSV
ncbi:ABC transporter substrate-binding protein [Lacrimispora sp. BS-2]|uniref:ABC transporter substrate-binding protein n=1 Tax=Lacrimispora sp. BS-2 TaxID=3151850 RepID=A0AAU7PLD6_9FIRM